MSTFPKATVWALAVLLLAGCGDTAGTLTESSPTALRTTHVTGLARSDRPLADAEVSFYGRDGSALATTSPVRTDVSGLFWADVLGELSDFRVVVRGANETYASDYRDFRVHPEMLAINPLTNLVSAHQQAHPELGLPASEQVVRNFLRLPADHTVRHHVINSHRPGFHVGRYLEQAARARSDSAVTPYVSQLVTAMDAVQAPTVPNQIFSDTQRDFWERQSIQLGAAVVSTLLQAEGFPASALIGWSVNLILAETGTNPAQAAFAALAREIEALGGEVASVYSVLRQEIAEDSFTDALDTVQSQLAPIQSFQAAFRAGLDFGLTNQQKQALATEVTDPDFTAVLPLIHAAQMGAGAAPGLIQQAAGLAGLEDRPFFCNPVHFNPVISEFNYFAGQQTAAIGLIVEGFHSLLLPDLAQAREWYDRYLSNLAAQASALPQPLGSDDVVLVRSCGLLFYRHAIGRHLRTEADDFARTFQTGDYKHFRVATSSDMLALLDKDRNFSIADLKAAGFDFTTTERDPSNRDHSSYFVGMGDDTTSALDRGVERLLSERRRVDPWGDDHYCFFLVADSASQESDEAAAVGTLQSLTVEQSAPTQLKAVGRYAVSTLRGISPSEIRGDDQGYTLGTTTVALDVTSLVGWSSSDSFVLRVQNPPASNNVVLLPTTPPLPFGAGVITWLRSGSSTVTASAVVPFGPRHQVTGTLSLTNSNVPPPTVVSVVAGPRNLLLNTAPSVTTIALQGAFSDGSSRTLRNVTWTTSIPQARVVDIGGEYQLDLSAAPTGNSFTVTGTSGGRSDTITFYVNIP